MKAVPASRAPGRIREKSVCLISAESKKLSGFWHLPMAIALDGIDRTGQIPEILAFTVACRLPLRKKRKSKLE
jgi:hypothetical protein